MLVVVAALTVPALATTVVLADSFTATIVDIDQKTGLVTLDDRSTLTLDGKQIEGTLVKGAVILVDYVATENGYDPINYVKVISPKGTGTKLN